MFEFLSAIVVPIIQELFFVATIVVANKLIKQIYSHLNHVNSI